MEKKKKENMPMCRHRPPRDPHQDFNALIENKNKTQINVVSSVCFAEGAGGGWLDT